MGPAAPLAPPTGRKYVNNFYLNDTNIDNKTTKIKMNEVLEIFIS
jgi:hypothetical protein